MRPAGSVAAWMIRIIIKMLCRVDSRELAAIPLRGPLIIVVNHINFLEVPLLFVLSQPRQLIGLIKKETWEQPLLGRIADWWGAIPIDRSGDVSALKQTVRMLDQGGILAIAPEGTRSGDGRMRKARPGIVAVARRTGATILPVAHWGGEQFWQNLRALRRTNVRIRVGRPFRLAQGLENAGRDTRQQVTDEIMGQLSRLLPHEYRGVYAEEAGRKPRFLEFTGDDIPSFHGRRLPARSRNLIDEVAVEWVEGAFSRARAFIFDVDHTVTRRSTGSAFARQAIAERVVSRSFIAALPIWYLRYRAGAMSVEDLLGRMPVLVGLSRDDLLRVADTTFHHRILPVIYRAAEGLIRACTASGRHVCLATSSLEIIVRPLAEYLGLDAVIATKLEFSEGRCTGRFLAGPAFGREKLEMVLRYLESKGLSPSECAFFSDSVFDLPLLRVVGFPAVVNPDSRLLSTARTEGWPVLKFKTLSAGGIS